MRAGADETEPESGISLKRSATVGCHSLSDGKTRVVG
jgi:hypothetical protein